MLLKALQPMLIQSDNKKVFLLLAWPKDWDVNFRVHAPYQTTLEGQVRGEEAVKLSVRPPQRKSDIIIPDGK